MFSVLSFHIQLEDAPEDIYKKEHAALRKFNAGPGNWVVAADLFNLKENYGFPMSYPSLRVISLAAKLRVMEFEVTDSARRAKLLIEAWVDASSRPFPLSWYQSSHLCILDRARQQAIGMGVTSSSVRRDLLRRKAATGRLHEDQYIKCNFQRVAYEQLLKASPEHQDAHERIRAKLKRWQVSLVPRLAADRSRSLLFRLKRLVQPRVQAAAWKTLWNGWCTRRRFQQAGTCLVCDSVTARDCIEHYAFCGVFQEFRCNTLHLPRVRSLDQFLMLEHTAWDDTRLILEAVALFALYACFNFVRTKGRLEKQACIDMMERNCYHAVREHKLSSRALTFARSHGRTSLGHA